MRHQQILYRKAVETDCPEMVAVHYAAVRAIASTHYPAEVLAAWSPEPDDARHTWLAGVVAQDAVLCTVATRPDGSIVGFCIASPGESLLRAIYVHPDFAGNGIGRGLLEQAQTACRALGVASLWLNASYNAEAFYLGCGYEVVGPVTHPLSDEALMGATRMVKHIGVTR
ncbi:MAG: GNAT family N-acetyltransferase [Pseudomonadota bacterium]|nr:GNAT family N-acetyltransferase [Pseudomonadota bacterium]